MGFIGVVADSLNNIAQEFLGLNVFGASTDALITIGVGAVALFIIFKKLGISISMEKK